MFQILDGLVIKVNGVLGIVDPEIPPKEVKRGDVKVNPFSLCRYLLLSAPHKGGFTVDVATDDDVLGLVFVFVFVEDVVLFLVLDLTFLDVLASELLTG